MYVSASALWGSLGTLALLFAGKMVPKLVGVYPLARRHAASHAMFTTLLMSTGLTFGTISALYGLNAGIIDRTQFSLLVAVVVASAIIPTVIAQRFFQPVAADEHRAGAVGRRGACRRGCGVMPFTRILVAIDGSEGSEHAFEKALELAGVTGATLLALAVEGPLPAYAATVGEVEEVKREKDIFFTRLLASVRGRADEAGIPMEVELRVGHAAELIVHHARERHADLVVLGHRGHFLRDRMLGSTADRVAEHADCPVMIVR